MSTIVPWTISAVSVLLGTVAVVSSWTAPVGSPSSPAAQGTCEDGELRTARQRLVSMESEAVALRSELDRMRLLLAMREANEAADVASGEAALSDEQRMERLAGALERLTDLVPRLKENPDRETLETYRDALHAMFRSPMDDPSLFRTRYEAAEDLMEKKLILPHLAARLGPDLVPFLSRELERTEDPGYRASLLAELRVHSKPEEDPVAREILLQALASEQDPQAKRYAIEALGEIPSPEVQGALLDVAANGGDAAVREAAIRRLAEVPGSRDQLLSALSADPDPRLRTITECAVTLAETPAAGS